MFTCKLGKTESLTLGGTEAGVYSSCNPMQ